MAGGVGNLTVGLGLDYSAYTAGLTKAQAQAKQFADQTKAVFVGTLGADLTRDLISELAKLPSAFVGMVKGAIDAADHLNDLSKKTGIAVETLGGIGFAASQAGGDLETATAAIGKLNKTIAEAAAGNKDAKEFFDVLGISVRDAGGKIKDAGTLLIETSDKFASFEDGPNKAALALRGFGKAGADFIPILDEGGKALQQNIDYFKRYSGVTTETAKKADEFNDTLGQIKLLTSAFATTLASELLPALQAIATALRDSKEEGGTFRIAIVAIKTVLETVSVIGSDVVFVLQQIGKGFVAVGEASVALANRDFSGVKTIFSAYNEQAATARKSLDAFQAKVLGLDKLGALAGSVDRFGEATTKKGGAPGLRSTTSGPVDDPARKQLDNQLKAIEANIDSERQLFQTRNRFIELFNSQSLLSITDYYNAREVAQRRASQTELDLIDNEVLALQAFQARKATSQTDREGAEGKIIDLRKRRARVEQDADADAIERDIRRRQAQEDLAKAFQGVNAQVLDLTENFAQAAAIKFDLQFDTLSKVFDRNGNEAGKEALATLRAAAIAQGAFQKAALDSSRTIEDLGRAEDRIAISVQTGARGSIEALIAEGEARRKIIPTLEAQVAAQEAIARAAQQAGTAGAVDLVARADAARIALERLKASADPVAEAINKALGADFNTALDDFVTGTKTASEAFKSFAKSVLNDILKLGSKSITESLFGGSGGIGGFISDLIKNQGGGAGGGLFGGILGGSITGIVPAGTGDSASAASEPTADAVSAITKLFSDTGATAAKAAESTAATAAATAVTAMATAATAATTALTSLAATQTLSSAGDAASSAGDIASLFADFGGFFAGGGDIKPGQWGVVGENGPELAFGGNAGKAIQPAVVSAPARVNNIVVNVPPGSPREYGMQVGADVARQLAIADRRNN